MIHERLDIGKWKTLFPLAKLREDWLQEQRQRPDVKSLGISEEKLREQSIEMLGGQAITSPYHIAVVEQVREEALVGLDLTKKYPTDLFVFARGEAENRAVTKIGGLPYWPRNRIWPCKHGKLGKGEPLTFVAQFCFADSKDITGDLPGDLLLLFGEAEQLQYERFEGFDYQWVSLGEADVVSPEDVPMTRWAISPCYGVIYRTYDLPGTSECFEPYRQPYQLDILEGTKIGGVPRWIQSPMQTRVPSKFLCSLGSIQPEISYPPGKIAFPYLNVPEPLLTYDEENNLIWGDAGCAYFLIDQEGQLFGGIQSY